MRVPSLQVVWWEFSILVFWHSMWNLLILHSAFHLFTYIETEETSAPCASAATSGSVIWIFLHLTCIYIYIYIYIYILQSLPWSFGIPCEIFLFSTAPSTSLLTFETEETSAPCASAATTGSVIWIFLHLTCTYIYIYTYYIRFLGLLAFHVKSSSVSARLTFSDIVFS